VRHTETLAASYRALGRVLGFMLLLLGAVHLVPLALLLVFPSESAAASSFALPAAGAFAAGGLLVAAFRRADPSVLTLRYGVLVTFLAWTFACLLSSVPFALQGMSFRLALFESVSGWSTTGLTVVDVEAVGPLLLFWRSLLQLLGGAGLVLVMASALVGPWATGLYQAEGHGEPLLPHMGRTARTILGIYLGYAVLGIGAFVVAGMPFFDAVNHGMTSLATGGFSTKSGSIGEFDSAAIEGVAVVLMFLGQLNFMVHFLVLRGKWGPALRHGELRVFFGALLVGLPLLYFGAASFLWGDALGLRRVVFEGVSALTGTGFSIAPDHEWNSAGAAVLVAFMLIGGGINSTAGAIKQHRVYLVVKSVLWQIRQFFLPRSAVHRHQIWRGEERIVLDDEHLRGVATYVVLYLLVWTAGSLVIMLHGYSMQEALFEFASALGGVGLTVGVTGPGAPPGILWTEIAGMFLGRLEFFVVILGIGKIVLDLRDAWRYGRGAESHG
jgi:trk system potassium uptake protein TrkH